MPHGSRLTPAGTTHYSVCNPLQNIRTTADAQYVMKGGRLYDAMSLDEVWPRSVPFGPTYGVNNDMLQVNVKGTDWHDVPSTGQRRP